jgi:photosystem II stability/assembly factor-like uncharacterized protein
VKKVIFQALFLSALTTILGLILPGQRVLARADDEEPVVMKVKAGPANASIRTIFFQPDGWEGVVGGTDGLLAFTQDRGQHWHESTLIQKEVSDARSQIDVVRIIPVKGVTLRVSRGIRFRLLAIAGPYILSSDDSGASWSLLTKVKLSSGHSASPGLLPYLFGGDTDTAGNAQFLLSEVAPTKNDYEFKRSALYHYSFDAVRENASASDRFVHLQSEFDGVEFASLYIATEKERWLVGERGVILVSRNNGWDWSRVSSPAQDKLWDVVFTTQTRGWAVGKSGTILATVNANDWTRVKDPNGDLEDYRAVRFKDACRGWIAGKGGSLLYSREAGSQLQWVSRTSGTTEDLYALAISKSVGDAGAGDIRPSTTSTYLVWAAGDNKTVVLLTVTDRSHCAWR